MRSSTSSATMKKVMRALRRYWPFLLLSLLLAFVSVALTLWLPLLVGDAIDCIVGPGKVDFSQIFAIFRRAAAAIAATALAQWLMSACNNRVTFLVVRDLRNQAFSRIQNLPLQYLDAHPYGEMVSRVIADADQFSEGLLMGFTQLFTGVMTILGTIGFMLSKSVAITLVVVLVTPLSLLVARFIAKKTYVMFKKQSQTRGEQTAFLDEMIQNQKVVQAFGREAKSMEEFDEINDRLEYCSLRAIFFSSITNPSTRFVNNIVYAGVSLVGALSVVSGHLSVGGLSVFLSYANQYTKPFNEISSVVTELENAITCAARLFDILEQPEQTPDRGLPALHDVQGRVTLSGVRFSYDPARPLIENFHLEVAPGQRIALVGPTGCGKTTLINLLMRFYDVQGGSVCVDGADVQTVTRHSLRRNYGMVLQETWLKSGTIWENIAMGRPESSRQEIEAAAKAAHAHSFILRLPQGYDTVIGEDGGSLSQGQKQLLCIARIMLCLPPMLILDEATSSIDTRTEVKIQEAFARLMQGRTSFIVAHRLSTIREADRILVMKDGAIIEQGSHETLMAQHGFYASLYESQFAQ